MQQANAWNGGNPAVPGVLHLEIDQGQLPQQYRPQDMERAVVFGRWIIDAGHPDFGSEIHPPLLIVRAQDLGVGDYTSSTVIARGYLVSQIFGWKTDLVRTPRGLYDSIVDQIKLQLQSQELTLLTQSGDPNAQVTADPAIIPGYFGARIVSMPFILRPGTGRKSSFDRLSVAYRLAGRSGVPSTSNRLTRRLTRCWFAWR